MDSNEGRGITRANRPGVLVWLQLARTFRRIERAATAQLRHSGLSVAQFDVLAHVGANEGAKQQELADALFVTKGNICQLLDKMEQSGLIERRPEGRSNRVYLTPAGRALFAAVVPAHEALIAAQFSPLTRAEQRQLTTLLRRVVKAKSTTSNTEAD